MDVLGKIRDPSFCPEEELMKIIEEILYEIDIKGQMFLPVNCSYSKRRRGSDDNTSVILPTLGTAATAGVAVPTVATAGLTVAGFTSSGIAAGSAAAAAQSAIGSVAAGSTFATLQSIGATGGFAIFGPLGIGAAAVFGGGVFLYKLLPKVGKALDEFNIREEMKERVLKGTATLGVDLCKRCWIKMKLQIIARDIGRYKLTQLLRELKSKS